MPLLLFLNLSGLLCAVLVFLAAGGLMAVGPALENAHHGNIAISAIIFAVGGLMELTPLRPRFFFVPIWLIGLGMAAWHLSRVWL